MDIWTPPFNKCGSFFFVPYISFFTVYNFRPTDCCLHSLKCVYIFHSHCEWYWSYNFVTQPCHYLCEQRPSIVGCWFYILHLLDPFVSSSSLLVESLDLSVGSCCLQIRIIRLLLFQLCTFDFFFLPNDSKNSKTVLN